MQYIKYWYDWFRHHHGNNFIYILVIEYDAFAFGLHRRWCPLSIWFSYTKFYQLWNEIEIRLQTFVGPHLNGWGALWVSLPPFITHRLCVGCVYILPMSFCHSWCIIHSFYRFHTFIYYHLHKIRNIQSEKHNLHISSNFPAVLIAWSSFFKRLVHNRDNGE